MSALLFFVFAGLAIGCAISMIVQRHPLYSAISLIGVLIALACLYVTLAAPFIAAVQVIVYAGAIMVLVVFVIMLLNVEEEERHSIRLRYLVPTAKVFAGLIAAEAAFIFYFVNQNATDATRALGDSNVGLTSSIGRGLFTIYLLPFEVTSILLLMAIVGAMSLARRPRHAKSTKATPSAPQVPILEPVSPRGGTSVLEGGSTELPFPLAAKREAREVN